MMRLCMIILVGSFFLHAEEKWDYTSFTALHAKNIFSSKPKPTLTRTSGKTPSEVKTPEEKEKPIEKLEPEVRFDLYGVLIEAEKSFVFTGNEKQELKTLSIGDKVHDLEIKAVSSDGIELSDTNQNYTLKVGASLKRRGAAPWTLSQGELKAPSLAEKPKSEVSKKESEGKPAGDQFSSKQRALLEKLRARRSKELK